jgi:hypothetical protein
MRLVERRAMPPFGHFSLIRFAKDSTKDPFAKNGSARSGLAKNGSARNGMANGGSECDAQLTARSANARVAGR